MDSLMAIAQDGRHHIFQHFNLPRNVECYYYFLLMRASLPSLRTKPDRFFLSRERLFLHLKNNEPGVNVIAQSLTFHGASIIEQLYQEYSPTTLLQVLYFYDCFYYVIHDPKINGEIGNVCDAFIEDEQYLFVAEAICTTNFAPDVLRKCKKFFTKDGLSHLQACIERSSRHRFYITNMMEHQRKYMKKLFKQYEGLEGVCVGALEASKTRPKTLKRKNTSTLDFDEILGPILTYHAYDDQGQWNADWEEEINWINNIQSIYSPSPSPPTGTDVSILT
ncbi:hypothetical protein FHG87_021746 [Trinorchestia longiramus]|nr:hypothetical protein FHG87_021746 [Trinorchestia longiramus]